MAVTDSPRANGRASIRTTAFAAEPINEDVEAQMDRSDISNDNQYHEQVFTSNNATSVNSDPFCPHLQPFKLSVDLISDDDGDENMAEQIVKSPIGKENQDLQRQLTTKRRSGREQVNFSACVLPIVQALAPFTSAGIKSRENHKRVAFTSDEALPVASSPLPSTTTKSPAVNGSATQSGLQHCLAV